MKFTIVTLFPELFSSFLQASLLAKAIENGVVTVDFVDPRRFTSDRHHSVDDTPYGGGEGMVLKPEPIVAAIEHAMTLSTHPSHRVMCSPQGRPLKQADLDALARQQHVVLVCGRYEGFDERIRTYVDDEISLGDFVLNGGEVPAMALIDGVARLLPGVIGNAASLLAESHRDGLLEYPHYTRPRLFREQPVPQVLLNGDHSQIAKWRADARLERTRQRRPDLWQSYQRGLERPQQQTRVEVQPPAYIALMHHPVYDKDHRIVTTALTNLDLHDIARSARTFGLAGYFLVTPIESQRELISRILGHWKDGQGATSNEKRSEALALAEVAAALPEVIEQLELRHRCKPLVVATTAARRPGQVTYAQLRRQVAAQQPVLVLLGTGWGLVDAVVEAADAVVEPICGPGAYNHLSVRSAAAIILDRLFGMRHEQDALCAGSVV